MLTNKYINVITAVCLSLCLIISVFLVGFSGTDSAAALSSASQPEYVSKIFGNDLITIDIQTDESSWNTMVQNARSEEYIACDVVINGTKFESVGVRPKGNSSLTMVDASTQRYSLKFNFDKYINGQSCYGLDSFVINNMISDATYMKEYISYDIMRYIGVDTPLFTYAAVSVNGEYEGLYLAIEKYEESFMNRTYGTNDGQLYNVKSMEFGGGKGMGAFRDVEADNKAANNTSLPQSSAKTSDTGSSSSDKSAQSFPDKMGGGFKGFSNGGGSFVYTDDSSDSYSSIFGNAVFDADESDYQRVIKAIKALNDGTDIEKYFDVDNLIRYFAAHTVVVNLDSYVSSMQQNYYVYEQDGKITILPWDYNLAFGGFQSGSASTVVNFPIDTPVSGISLSDRPLLNIIFENETYKEKYHQYLQEIVDGFFNSGVFSATIDSINNTISTYVQNDPTAFYTYEEYNASLPVFKQLGLMRAQSISGQLNGTIPSTTDGQNADSSKLIDASSISLPALGSQGGGGGNGGNKDFTGQDFPFGKNRKNDFAENSASSDTSATKQTVNTLLQLSATNDSGTAGNNMPRRGGNMQPPPDMPNGGQMPDGGGQMPDGGGQMPDFGYQMPPDDGQNANNDPNANSESDTESGEQGNSLDGQMPGFNGQMPDFGGQVPDINNNDTAPSGAEKDGNSQIWWIIGSLIALAAACVFVKLYPRRY